MIYKYIRETFDEVIKNNTCPRCDKSIVKKFAIQPCKNCNHEFLSIANYAYIWYFDQYQILFNDNERFISVQYNLKHIGIFPYFKFSFNDEKHFIDKINKMSIYY